MKRIWLFALILMLVGCSNDLYLLQPSQKVLFHFEQSNFAWGRFQKGWFIDDEGYVRAYQQPSTWNYPDSMGFLSKSDMDENLAFADSVCFKVDDKVLVEHVKLIGKASEGKLSEMVNEMCDFGSIVYYCYKYDSKKQRYQTFLLDMRGDNRQFNNASESKNLYDWLLKLNTQVYPQRILSF